MKVQHIIQLLTVLALMLAIFLFVDVMDLRFEEPRRALVSSEMVLSGDYIVPHLNGSPYYNKPPFFNWLIAGLFNLSGSKAEWLVRLPSLLSLLLTGLFLYLFVSKYLNKKTAILSSFIFITSADIFFFGTLVAGEIDFFYMLVVSLQVMAIYHFYRQKNFLLLFCISYFLMSIGVLTKGLPSFLFQGLTLLMMAFWQKDLKFLFRWQHFAGLLIGSAVIAGYFLLYDQRGGNAAAFITNLFNESSTKSGLGENKQKLLLNSLTFPLQMLRFMAPWALLSVFFFFKDNTRILKANSVLLFCFLFVIVNIPPYWFTGSVKSRYMYMFFPFIAVLLSAVFFAEADRKSKLHSVAERVMFALMILSTAVFVALPFIPVLAGIKNLIIVSSFFFLAGIVLCILFRKWQEQRIWLFVFFVVMLRIAMAFYYFPIYTEREKTKYKGSYIADRIVQYSNGNEVSLAGPTEFHTVKAAIGPIIFNETVIGNPVYLPYQISYYYSKKTGKILQFNPEIIKPGFYILSEKYLQTEWGKRSKLNILYSFQTSETGEVFHLAEVK